MKPGEADPRDVDPPGPITVREGAAVLAAEQAGVPFLLLRDADGDLAVRTLDPADSPVTLGRAGDVLLAGDPQVSRVHAELVAVGTVWTLVDDGLSTNGVFVNGERVGTRRRLRDLDVVRAGSTLLVFRSPTTEEDLTERGDARAVTPTPAQRAVLAALCRPLLTDPRDGVPAGNEEIARELVLSVDAVKGHLRHLYDRFGLRDDQPSRKRLLLAREAIRMGLGGTDEPAR